MTTAFLSALAALAFQTVAQTAPAPGSVLTLDEALRIAEQNAFSVRTAESQVRQSQARLSEAHGLVSPKVVTSASYTRNDKAPASSGGGSGSIDSKQAGVQLTMPVDITGVLGRGIRGANSTVRSAEENLAASRNTLKLSVRSAYYAVLRSQALVGVAQQTVASALQAVTTERQREAAGVSAHVDVLRLEAQLAQARADLIGAEAGLALGKENLNYTLGRAIETPFDLQEPSELPTLTMDPDSLTRSALNRRPEIQSVRFQREALEWIRRVQQGGLLPSLNLSANYNKTIDPAAGARDYTAFATLAMSWPIFDSGVTRSRVQQARENERQAEIQQEQLELGISLEVRQAVTALVNAKSTLDVAQSQVTAAAETYRLAQVRLEAGEGTSLEVSTALTALVQAQTSFANARYNYLTAYAQLQRAVAADDPNAASTEQGTGTK